MTTAPPSPQPRRDGFGQFTQAVEVDRQRFGGPDHAGDAGDVAERVEASRQRLNDLGHALGRADIGLDEGVERPRRRVDVDADNIGPEREREFADPRADPGGNSGDDDRFAQQHHEPPAPPSPASSFSAESFAFAPPVSLVRRRR